MFRSRSQSFRTRLVFATAATLVIVQMIGAVFDVFTEYRKLSAEMDSKGRLIVDQSTAAILLPLWDFDQPLVEQIMVSLFDVSHLQGARLWGTDGKVSFEVTSPEIADPDIPVRRYTKAVVYDRDGIVEELGTLEVIMSTAGLRAALGQVGVYQILLLVLTLLIASTSLFVVLRQLSKPLEDLRSSIHAIEREDFDHDIPGLDREDEIGALANALDGLREREAELVVLRRETDEKARRERKRIRQTLLSTRDAVVLVDESNEIIFRNAPAKKHFQSFVLGDRLVQRRQTSRSNLDTVRQALVQRREVDIEVTVNHSQETQHFQVRTGHIVDEDGTDLGGLFLASDVTEKAVRAEQISYLASHDPLTGLSNRRNMDETLADWVSQAEQPIAIMLADLDRFKSINDTLGHQLGDELLKKIAELLHKLGGPDDLVVRLGGDEFAVAARGDNAEHRLEKLASDALNALQDPIVLEGRKAQVTISAGIAAQPAENIDLAEMMRQADIALYEAKHNGRGRLEIYRGALSETQDRRRTMEAALKSAVAANLIYPVYQLQTSARDRSIVGLEALARWTDPDLGPVSPGEFIALAETTDLIEPLTRQMLIAACEAARQWHDRGYAYRVAVNISPKLFNGTVTKLVKDCLSITKCPPQCLELEITETVLMSNSEIACAEIEELRDHGLTIALDDFGMGYSSLNYLHQFPVDKIKVDRAFVAQINASPQGRAIVMAMVQLGHALNMSVTAEGAETEEDRLALKSCGADSIQGYVDSKPMSRDDVTQLLDFGALDLREAK